MNEVFAATDLEEVSGLGDDAFWNSRVKGLWVPKGRYQFSVHSPPDAGTAKGLALKMLDRLPG
ncbi:MAG: hypothetical protein HY650_05855 [Acidobacteria bacterium]|nr:hypothetical protein [Acidobacteriota bacterium]